MYAIPHDTELRLRTNGGLCEYSRLEYGTPDAS